MTVPIDAGTRARPAWHSPADVAAFASLLGAMPVRIRLARTHFPGRRPVQPVYLVRLSDGRDETVLAEFRPQDARDHAARATTSLEKSRNGQRSGLVGAPVVASVGGLVLRRPGLDERLPGLRLLYDDGFARQTLAGVTGRDPGPVRVRLAAHRLGKRAVLELRTRRGTVFARLRAVKSGDGADRLARHRAVWAALAPDAPLAIPAPLGERPDLGVSLFATLPGRPPDFHRDGAAVAAALDVLRRLDLAGLPVHRGADEAAILRAWHERCGTHCPELAATTSAMIADTCHRLAGRGGDLLPCHRDLHDKQILVARGRAGLLDFDTLSLADPAADPGNLLAHLFMAGEETGALRRVLDAPGVGLWRRAALLRLAMMYAFSDMPDGVLRRLLREAAT